MKLKFPLTVEKQQELVDAANPHSIPALVDLVVRCQDVLSGITHESCKVKTNDDRREFVRYVKAVMARMVE